MSNNLTVNCPTCKKKVKWVEASTYRPFCSERCQQIDLGAWASEEYSIPVEQKEEWSGTEASLQQSELSGIQSIH